MKKDFFIKEFGFWRHLVNFWSICFIAFIIYDFIVNNIYVETLNVLAIIYISILTIYVGNKEFERWYDRHRGQHPGEVFIIIWTLLVFSLIILDFILQKSYELPGAVLSSYVAVLTILAVTNKSKKLYRDKRRGAKK